MIFYRILKRLDDFWIPPAYIEAPGRSESIDDGPARFLVDEFDADPSFLLHLEMSAPQITNLTARDVFSKKFEYTKLFLSYLLI